MGEPSEPSEPSAVQATPPAPTLDARRPPPAPAEAVPAPLSLDQAYRRHAAYVAAVAVRILGPDPELDDLVQDVFLDAARGLEGLREPAALKGWLGRIAVRAAVRRLRARRLRRVLGLGQEPLALERLVSPQASPELGAQVLRVYRALDGLGAAERAAWVLRHVQGESLEVAATLCGCSLSTYQRRLERASQQLARELGDD